MNAMEVLEAFDMSKGTKEGLKGFKNWLDGIDLLDKEKADRIRSAEPVRNHGLFSKAERVLTIAGWSEPARRDIEIFKLVDTDGLTPLLAVLNDLASSDPDSDGDNPASA